MSIEFGSKESRRLARRSDKAREKEQQSLTRWKDIKSWAIFTIIFSALAAISILVVFILILRGIPSGQYVGVLIFMISAFLIGLGLFVILVKTITFRARVQIPKEQCIDRFFVYHGKTGSLIGAFAFGGLFLSAIFDFPDFGSLDLG